jgi:hypothetical protein
VENNNRVDSEIWCEPIELTVKSGVSHSAAGEVVDDDDDVCWHKK